MPSIIDRVGHRFGNLVVVKRASDYILPSNPRKASLRYICKCDCGLSVVVLAHALTSGNTSRCKECSYRLRASKNTKHGISDKPEYKTWYAMIKRCTDPKYHNWHIYGGRGIKVCAAWLESPEQFYCDMGPKPTPKHSLDRINVDGDYCMENCRWALPKEQARNRRGNIVLTYKGSKWVLSALAEHLGIPTGVLHYRAIKANWPAENWDRPVRACAKHKPGAGVRPITEWVY